MVEIRLGVDKEREIGILNELRQRIIAAWNHGEEREGGVSGIVRECVSV